MNIEIQPYFAEGERYPALIGVRVEGDEYETAYVSKGELADALDDNAKLRELVRDLYGYYVSGTLSPCDFCTRYDCEGNAPTVCVADEYDPDGLARTNFERRMRKRGVEVEG